MQVDFTKLLSALKAQSTPIKVVSVIAVALAAAVIVFSSCGTTRAVIRTSADNTSSSISITTNNPTNVSVSTGVDSLGFKINPQQ